MRVFVYRNLTKKCYSIKAMEGPFKGRVIAHANYLRIKNATFKVSEKGRERVRRERKKYVHAGILGEWDVYVNRDAETMFQYSVCLSPVTSVRETVSYNPYAEGPAAFVTRDGVPVHRADDVILVPGDVLAITHKKEEVA